MSWQSAALSWNIPDSSLTSCHRCATSWSIVADLRQPTLESDILEFVDEQRRSLEEGNMDAVSFSRLRRQEKCLVRQRRGLVEWTRMDDDVMLRDAGAGFVNNVKFRPFRAIFEPFRLL